MPMTLESAAAMVRSSSGSLVGSPSMNASSFVTVVARSSLCRMPAADFTISVTGQ
jgi:hypothetical protein